MMRFTFMVDFRINGTRQTGAVRKTKLPGYRLVGAVSNCADAGRLKTAPTGGESVYLFLLQCFGSGCPQKNGGHRRGYDSDALRETIVAQGAVAVIKPRKNRVEDRPYDKEMYKRRNVIERFFHRKPRLPGREKAALSPR